MKKKTVALELVEKAGIDVPKLVDLLVRNAAAELTTYYYYTILRVNLIGMEGEGLKQIAEDARIEDRNHFEALVPRIYELGGKLPDDIRTFADQAGCPDAYLPDSLGGTLEDRRAARPQTAMGAYPSLGGQKVTDV